MLKQLRDASNRPLAKIMMGILIFSFVGWGVANWIFGDHGVDDAIIRIGREPVKLATFERERARQLAAMDRAQQKQIYTDRAVGVYFSQQILSSLASQLMLEQRAEDLGLAVTNAAIASAIRAEPAFQEAGAFSPEKFDYVLAANGLTEAGFADYIRRSTLRDMVLAGVMSGVAIPDFAITAMFNARHAQRRIEYAAIRFDDFKAAAAPTEDQLRDTYAKNPRTVPEFRTVSYALVPADMSKPDSFDRAYAAAQKMEDSIVSGDAMHDAAAKHKAKFVKLAAVSQDWKTESGAAISDATLNEAARRAAWGLDEGMESEILETTAGFAILRVEKIEPAHVADMESMRAELIRMWKLDEQKKQAYAKANEILIKANKGELAQLSKATVGRTAGAPIEVLSAAFALPVGTKTIVPGQNAFFVLSVKESIAARMDEAQRTALRKEAAEMMQRVMRDDYSAFLSRKYPVKINDRLFRRLFGG